MTHAIKKTLATALALATLATGASAKDWIESFDLSNAGIDMAPVVVGVDQNGYNGPTSPVRSFGLSISGEAESGKRINGITFGAGGGISVIESNTNQWHYDMPWRDIGSGDRRTLSLEVSFGMSLASVAWQHYDPLEACEANMAAKLDQGWTKPQVLAREWELSVNAIFSAEMTVMRNINVRPATQVGINNMDTASDYYIYRVYVECAAVPAFENSVQMPGSNSSDNRPGRDFANDRDDDDRPSRDPRPARLSLQATSASSSAPRPSN